ncbi:MAG: PucR family transcriptional regulator [Pseudoclavibacter sp.]
MEERPEFGSGEGASRAMRLGTESLAIRTLLAIDAGRVLEPGATPEVVLQMQDYVHRRIPIAVVWATMRRGHSWFAEALMSAARELVPLEQCADELERISQLLFEVLTPFSDGADIAYWEEDERWIRSAAAARDEAVRSLLGGGDLDLRQTSHVLGYEIADRHHVAFVLWLSEPDPADTTHLQRMGRGLVEQLGAAQSVLIPVGQSELWLWAGAASEISVPPEMKQPSFAGGIAVGRAGRGLVGFRSSHAQAQETVRVTRDNPRFVGRLAAFDDVNMAALLTRDLPAAQAFVRDELGLLARDDPQTADLRQTVLAYFECRRSPQAAAAKLFVARNTVVYRIRRAEEILGRSVDERGAELWAALRLMEAFETQPSIGESASPSV